MLSIWLLVFPLGEIQMYLWMFRSGKIVLLATRFSSVTWFTILTPLWLLSWCRPSFPLSVWNYPLFPVLQYNLVNIFIWYIGKCERPLMVAQWLRCCATNRKVVGSIGIFHWHNLSDRTMALGSIQRLTEMSTRSIFWGVKTAGA
jgi:hypothetical protein